MSMGTIEPIGGADPISFIRGAITKYQGTGVDDELLNYIEESVKRARQDKESAEQLQTTNANEPCLGCDWERKRGGPCGDCCRAPLPLKKDMYVVTEGVKK